MSLCKPICSVTVLALIGSTFFSPAAMGGGMQGNMPQFSEFDLNKDGKVTEAEFTDARTARITKRLQEGYQMRGLANAPSFQDIDTNHDAAISPEEFASHQVQHQQQMRP